jgi:hydroxypyruvate reductase
MSGVAGAIAETPKPGDPALERARVSVIGSRLDAMRGAAEEAARRGFRVFVQEAPVTGEARLAAVQAVAAARAAARASSRPCCVISSGETTVHVRGSGRGGRNQELALGAVAPLSVATRPVVLASVGTDGLDGPTAAAGAIADSESHSRARAVGLDPEPFLAANNSHEFFAVLGDLIHTGATGTNVGDLQVFLLA